MFLQVFFGCFKVFCFWVIGFLVFLKVFFVLRFFVFGSLGF